jgi:lambda family phage portal protein
MNIFSLFGGPALNASAPSTAILPFMGASDTAGRTSTAAMPIDTRREISYFTRMQLVRKSRWLFNNMGLVRRMVNGVAKFSIGTGISHIPITGNPEFDTILEDYFTDWADSHVLCDVRRKLSFWRMQKHVLRGMFRDGEAFALKAPAPDEQLVTGTTILGRPRVQWLETQIVGNLNNSVYDKDPQGFREGILIDAYGAADKYRLIETSPESSVPTSTRIIDQSDILHIYDPERASQIHGLPWMYHGENSAIDILDLTALEKHAAKLHAAVAAAIKKRTADAGKSGFTGDLTKQRGTDAQGKSRVIAFENFAGGAGILQMALDEEFQLFTSNRPSATFAGFIDYLVRDIAWGFGVSPEFIWAIAGLGGPNARMILEDAKWFFEEVQDLMVALFCKPIYMWVIARGIERGEIVVPADVLDPYACAWQGPAKVTVDQGKEGNLELERLKSGCGTWEEFWAMRGKNGKKMVRRRIDEIADAMKYAKSKTEAGPEGVPFDYVIALNKGGDGGPSGDPNNPKPKPGDAPQKKIDDPDDE